MSERRAAVAGRHVERDGWPSVAVVMPIRDEGRHLRAAVDSVLAQHYPGRLAIWLAVAPSNDDTAAVAAAIAAADDRVDIVANPAAITPAGLNAAIAASTGEVVVRVDGHAELSPGYVERAVATMIRTGAVNVGGRQVPRPETAFEAAVAAVTTSPLGTGGARYRVGGGEGPVDTVYLGVFDRAAGDAVGWFDEGLIRNQDYELNIRLRDAGGTVWFDPELWVGYRPRATLRALAKQYFEYGLWKAEVVRRHPHSLRARQAAPAVLTPAMLLACLLGVGRRRRRLLVLPAAYLAALVGFARPLPVAPAIAATMHLSWGSGFLASAVSLGHSTRS